MFSLFRGFTVATNNLQTEEVQFDLLVTMLARPCIKRGRSDFVHQRHGKAEPAQVDVLEVVMAAVTGVHSDMIERRRLEVRELALVILAAVWADDTAKRPGCQTTRALQPPAAAIAWAYPARW